MSALIAGFCTTVLSSPVDVVKTRFVNSPPGQYASVPNCAMTMLTKEGPSAFFKGWDMIFHMYNVVFRVSVCFGTMSPLNNWHVADQP